MQGVVALLSIEVPAEALAALQNDLMAELASVRAFDDVAPVWTALRARGIKIGLYSNLATPYVQPVLQALPFEPAAYSWSCEVGHVKDEPQIYHDMCTKLGVEPGKALMVGDTFKVDVAGPRAVGIRAVHLQRWGPRGSPEAGLANLHGVLAMMD